MESSGKSLSMIAAMPAAEGRQTSIILTADLSVNGLGLISFNDATNADLKVVHPSDIYGIPYFQFRKRF